MGGLDRILRILVAVVIGVLYYTGIISGTLGTVLLVLGSVFIFTSLIGFCPLYAPFGMNTCSTNKE